MNQIKNKDYSNPQEFYEDFMLMFQNAQDYNMPGLYFSFEYSCENLFHTLRHIFYLIKLRFASPHRCNEVTGTLSKRI
jgi:hypothetical protein